MFVGAELDGSTRSYLRALSRTVLVPIRDPVTAGRQCPENITACEFMFHERSTRSLSYVWSHPLFHRVLGPQYITRSLAEVLRARRETKEDDRYN